MRAQGERLILVLMPFPMTRQGDELGKAGVALDVEGRIVPGGAEAAEPIQRTETTGRDSGECRDFGGRDIPIREVLDWKISAY